MRTHVPRRKKNSFIHGNARKYLHAAATALVASPSASGIQGRTRSPVTGWSRACVRHRRLPSILSDAGRRPFWSSSSDIRTLVVPRTHNRFGDRSFSAAGPRVWNDLPPGLRQPGLSFATFRRQLKTFLFSDRTAYRDSYCRIICAI